MKEEVQYFKIPNTEIEIPILSLHGKPYLQVPQRLVWFNVEKQDWTIVTERIKDEKIQEALVVTYKCTITDQDNKIKRVAHKTKIIEKPEDFDACETGAVGRALAWLGYGTADADDNEIVDAPTEHKKENKNDLQQTSNKGSASPSGASASVFVSNGKERVQNVDKARSADTKQAGPTPNVSNGFSNTLSDLTKKLGSEKAPDGIWAGKTFQEIFEKDKNQGLRYTKARHNDLRNNKSIPEWGKKYLAYADAQGAGLE